MNSRFAQRSSDVEIMDDLFIQGDVIDKTLKELEIINRLLGGNKVTINGIRQLLNAQRRTGTITFADLGCGGGDILKLIANWARKNQFQIQATGIDANPSIIAYAEKNSEDFPELNYKALNIFSEEFAQEKYDIILATLFTHHFSDDELVHLFQSLKKQARWGIVINDLHRHWFAYYSIKWITHFFSRSYMVKFDAPLSVLRSFRKKDLESILHRAQIKNYTLRWRWAFRWELIISTH